MMSTAMLLRGATNNVAIAFANAQPAVHHPDGRNVYEDLFDNTGKYGYIKDRPIYNRAVCSLHHASTLARVVMLRCCVANINVSGNSCTRVTLWLVCQPTLKLSIVDRRKLWCCVS